MLVPVVTYISLVAIDLTDHLHTVNFRLIVREKWENNKNHYTINAIKSADLPQQLEHDMLSAIVIPYSPIS